MMRILRRGILVVAVGALLSACGTAQPSGGTMMEPTGDTMMKPTDGAMMEPTGDTMMKPTDGAMMEPTSDTMMKPTDGAMMEPTSDTMMKPTDGAMMEPAEGAMMKPAWLTQPLTNVRTGQQFTLADFSGHPVYVEAMATWCTNCHAQLTSVQQAIAAQKSDSKAVFVALSVETDLPPAQLSQYATDNGFDLVFAVASPDLLKSLTETFGRTIVNPPSTPHFIIAPDGSYGELHTGASSAEQVSQLLQASHMES